MARKRQGLSGVKKEAANNLDDYFEELMESSTAETTEEKDVTPAVEQVVETEQDDSKAVVDLSGLGEKIEELDLETVEDDDSKSSDTSPSMVDKPKVKVKGGKLKIAPTKKVVKLSRESFTKLNHNRKYNLQKKNEENSKQLATETKTFSVRPDLLDILTDVVDGQYGMNTKIVQNALINELVRIGVLDEDSLSEMLDY